MKNAGISTRDLAAGRTLFIDDWLIYVNLPVMFRALIVAAVIVCIGCGYYLLMNPVQRDKNPFTRFIGKKMFPRLDYDQRQQRIAFLAGTILAAIVIGGLIAFLIKYLNRR